MTQMILQKVQLIYTLLMHVLRRQLIITLTGGTGVTVSSGEISIGRDVGTGANVQFNNVTVDGTSTDDTAATVTVSGNMIVGGNLTVQGTTTR